jgi:ribonuclease HI
MKVFFDGGCRPNPGAMEVAVVARGTLHHAALGYGTSELAEWLALLHALAVAKSLAAERIELRGDSLAVINQAKGVVRCRTPELARCRDAYREAAAQFTAVRLRHVKRTQNLAGIALARRWER